MKILLVAGGWSTEREISLRGARAIESALAGAGHEVTFFDLLHGFDHLLEQAALHDFAFLNLHGTPGEDGLVQAMLDRVGCPYQGSDAAGSFLALNKAAAKQVFRNAGLPTPDWEFLPKPPGADWKPSMPYPLFAKSNTGGSSLRLGHAENREELLAILDEIFAAGDEAIIEPVVYGKEITCGVLGRQALSPILIEPVKGDFFNFESKYDKNGAREICPAPIDAALSLQAQKLALLAHGALGLNGCSRADFILDKNNQFYLLEVNTLPGMTATSLVPLEAREAGMDFIVLLERLIELGMENHRSKK